MFDNGSLLRRRKRFKQTKSQRAAKKLEEKQAAMHGNTTANESSSFENNNNAASYDPNHNETEEFDDEDDDNNMNPEYYSESESDEFGEGAGGLGDSDNYNLTVSTDEDIKAITHFANISSIEAEMLMMKNKQDVLPYLDNGTEACRMLQSEAEMSLSDKEKHHLNMFLMQKSKNMYKKQTNIDLNTLNKMENPISPSNSNTEHPSQQMLANHVVKSSNHQNLAPSPVQGDAKTNMLSPHSFSSSTSLSCSSASTSPLSSSFAAKKAAFSIENLIGNGRHEKTDKSSSSNLLHKLNSQSIVIKKSKANAKAQPRADTLKKVQTSVGLGNANITKIQMLPMHLH